ncbi:MAG: hypothetical protein KGY41_05600 [Desulfovermiculus sp.]|nr:hypothetical protein [Desulfovermiculus sp.]
MAVRVCLARLIFLLFLLIPLSLTWIVSPRQGSTFSVFPELGYQIFLICGFLLTIVFLLVRNRFSNRIAFFWIQLGADLTLVCFLLLITGGLQSNFAFIGLALLFLYGRTLGLHAANTLAACLGGFYLGLALFQAMHFFQPLDLGEASLFCSLHLLALALMLLLVRMHTGRMNTLLQEMAERDRKLRNSESMKSKVMDWMSSGLLVVDRQGLVSTINPQALDWANLQDIDQAVSRPLEEIFPSLHAQWSTWGGDQPLRAEFLFSDQLFGATLTQLPDQQGTLILFSDITRIKELERQVQEMEKMATVGELAAGLAHEIKNPLAGIKASLQLLPSNTLPAEKQKRLYQVIEHDIQRLSHLLTNFLTFARPKEAKAESVHLAETVRSCLFTLQSDFHHVHFETRDIPEDKYWKWDPNHLHQVLLNILMNASQATSDLENPWVGIGWEKTDENEIIWIADNGPGLDPRIVNKIFDPFATTKSSGSGLGLSIAQRLAHQNKARIEITQNTGLDHGVTARIIINREP